MKILVTGAAGFIGSKLNQVHIETFKNVGLNVKEYFTYVFHKLMEGEMDYDKLIPSAVAL